MITYYNSPPIRGMTPGIVIRTYLVNRSSITPINTFVSIYANLPNGIMPLVYTYGSSITIPFSNTNWAYTMDRWLKTDMSVSGYDTSLLVFITYVHDNESWKVPIVIPYNVGWVLAVQRPGLAANAVPMYILATVYINVDATRPFMDVTVNRITNMTNQQVFSTYNGYTLYNCSVSGRQLVYPAHQAREFIPRLTCLAINGPLPLAWVTWDSSVLNNDRGLEITLAIAFSGTLDWNATAIGYGYVGTSYITQEDWFSVTPGYVLGSQISKPGSLYYYYDNGTWALVQYGVWYIDSETGAMEYLASVTVSEVLYVPEYDGYGAMIDYGNGTVSLLYYNAMPWIKEYIGYSTLNMSSITYYANFAYASTGSEYLYECNGPVNIVPGEYYQILLGGINTAIAPGLITTYNSEPFTLLLGMNNAIPSVASIASSPTLFNSQSM